MKHILVISWNFWQYREFQIYEIFEPKTQEEYKLLGCIMMLRTPFYNN